MQPQTTIVSCYYLIENNKKIGVSDYLEWITNFLLYCDSPIIMFSNGFIADAMDKFRTSVSEKHAKNWHLILLDTDDLDFSNYTGYWDKIQGKYITVNASPIVHKIWANKTGFLEKAIKLNPFSTEQFFWCDAGCWRNKTFAQHYAKDWFQYTIPQGIHLSWVKNLAKFQEANSEFMRQELFSGRKQESIMDQSTLLQILQKNKLLIQENDVDNLSVAGAIFGGTKDELILYCKCVKETYKLFYESSILPNTDQIILAVTSFDPRLNGKVINYDIDNYPIHGDSWFFFQYYNP